MTSFGTKLTNLPQRDNRKYRKSDIWVLFNGNKVAKSSISVLESAIPAFPSKVGKLIQGIDKWYIILPRVLTINLRG